jgi:hypothetical protein
VNESLFDRRPVPLAAVCCGSPVLDVQGAFVGCVEYVRTGEPDAPARCDLGFVKVRRDGPQGREFFVSPAQIAYVADDHLRLSVTADDVRLSADHV